MYKVIDTNEFFIEYTVCDNKTIFVHHLYTKNGYEKKGYTYKIFDILKSFKLPIILECWPTLEEFYNKHGFTRDCIGREGYLEMIWRPKE